MLKNIILSSVTILFTSFCFSQKPHILFVMSVEGTLHLNNGSRFRQTGVLLNEFYLAYKSVTDAGDNVEFAAPDSVTLTAVEKSVQKR